MSRETIIARCVKWLYWFISSTWRVKAIRPPERLLVRQPFIGAHWHGDELFLIRHFAFSQMAVLVSRSRDGEIQNHFLTRLGYQVVRGSSSRGAVGGLKGLIDRVRAAGVSASLAVDGPRGPVYQVKPGVLKLAQQTGLPIIPGAASAEWRFVFKKAWNKAYLPLPFSKCVVVYGAPMPVPENITEEAFLTFQRQLEEKMLSLKEEAESYFSRAAGTIPVAVPLESG